MAWYDYPQIIPGLLILQAYYMFEYYSWDRCFFGTVFRQRAGIITGVPWCAQGNGIGLPFLMESAEVQGNGIGLPLLMESAEAQGNGIGLPFLIESAEVQENGIGFPW